jgi:hypothetical protein
MQRQLQTRRMRNDLLYEWKWMKFPDKNYKYNIYNYIE